MRADSSRTAAFAIAVIAIWLLACAGKSENGPTILAGIATTVGEVPTGSLDPRLRALGAEGPILLPYRAPGSGGVAYRINLEVEGDRASRKSSGNKQQPPVREAHALEAEFRELPVEGDRASRKSSGNKQQPTVREAHALEAEFRELPVEGADSEEDMFLVGLDRLLYTEKQAPPQTERKIEIGDDRLRIMTNGETSIDNRGNRVVGSLAPRLFLNRIFGVVSHDPSGNPIRLSSRGAPAARDFLNGIPILGAIAYAMVSLPEDPITPGSRWTGVRIPPSRTGELGLSLTVDYTLAGFEIFEKVPCAMILLNARIDENAFTGLTGLKFDRVQATLDGTAWVELENSLVRRVVLSDQIRASWAGRGDPKMATEHRIQHQSKLELVLRDPKRKSKKWSDGTPRFDSR